MMCDVHKNLERQGVTIFWLQIIDDVSVQKSGKIKLRGVSGGSGKYYLPSPQKVPFYFVISPRVQCPGDFTACTSSSSYASGKSHAPPHEVVVARLDDVYTFGMA
jgi:hypothetical protein